MIIARIRNTSRWMYSTATRIGLPLPRRAWIANPVSSATSSVCRTSPSVNADTSVVGMMPSRKSTVPTLSATWPWPSSRSVSVSCSPSPGCRMLPTISPMASATVDITRKYPMASVPTLPTFAAFATEPTPITIVQKMIGLIIILIRLTKPVPSGLSSLAKSGQTRPTRMPSATAARTAM